MKKILVMMFLGFLVLGLIFNFPIVLANDGPHGNSPITGSAIEDDEEKTKIEKRFIDAEGREVRLKKIVRFKDGEYEIRTKLEVEGEGDNLRALTSDGKSHRIRINPEEAKSRIRKRLNASNISSISLEERRDGKEPGVVYNIRSDHPGRFLGIFKMILKIQSDVSLEDGEVSNVRVPWWAFLLTGLDIPEDVLEQINKTKEKDDGENNDEETENNAPVINPISDDSVNENSEYTYQVEATDANENDNLTYSLTQTPTTWIEINSTSGLINGTSPSVEDDTEYEITVEVSDGELTDTQTYNLTVMNVTV